VREGFFQCQTSKTKINRQILTRQIHRRHIEGMLASSWALELLQLEQSVVLSHSLFLDFRKFTKVLNVNNFGTQNLINQRVETIKFNFR
jgi:hypothetical protein